MIISHKHKFIFIKTNRTAGTSIQVGLEEFCGPNDVVCEMGPFEEPLKNHRPRNEGIHRGHDKARMVKDRVGLEIWDSYYTAAFVRNPWDRLVSNFRWSCHVASQKCDPKNFQKWANWVGDIQVGNWNYYTEDGKIIVDFVGRYEYLQRDYVRMCTKMGIGSIKLPQTKFQSRPKHYDYRTYYTHDMIDFVRNHPTSKPEIKHFGYKF
jgi:hypothetical protein